MELQFCYVVVVAFGVGLERVAGLAGVPVVVCECLFGKGLGGGEAGPD